VNPGLLMAYGFGIALNLAMVGGVVLTFSYLTVELVKYSKRR